MQKPHSNKQGNCGDSSKAPGTMMMNFRLSIFIFILLASWYSIFGQSNGDCLDCHNDPEFTMEKLGKEISLHVDPTSFTASAHGELKCVDCHVGFDPDEEPHKEVITPVNCAPCHKEEQRHFSSGSHAKEMNCSTCHENVHTPAKTARALLSNCESCHESSTKDFRESVHFAMKEALTCYSCHNPHKAEIELSANCLSCHGENEYVEKHIPNGDAAAMQKYQESIHADGNAECSDCHGAHKVLPIDDPNSPVNKMNVMNTCNNCHDDVVDEYRTSEHFATLKTSPEIAPTCTVCHGEHDIKPITDSRSAASRAHEVELCLSCHMMTPEVQEKMTHDPGFIAAYEKSVHGREFLAGNIEAAICSDCHGSHAAMKAFDPNSKINKLNIATTCGKCHEQISEEFAHSVHGESLVKGVLDSPTCTDCHGEHEIIEIKSPESPVAAQNVSVAVCGPCHNSVKLATKFGLPARNYDSFLDSYHGLAVRFGSAEAANCASCHGVHNILPSSDPRSMIHEANLGKTCGSCHPGINEGVKIGKVHLTTAEDSDKLLYWIATIYLWIIIGTIGAMGLHNILDWFRKTRNIYRKNNTPNPFVNIQEQEAKKAIHYVRMTLNERIQHILLATTFILLVITGFMLKFPDAWWVLAIRSVGGEQVFVMRGWLHRVAAVIMTGISLYHVYYVTFTPRGRQLIKDLWFRTQDFRDMVQMLKYNLGISKQKPQFDRFNYIEKSEYWALIWGTVVMSITGFALWFENQTMAYFSKLFIDVCDVIHYYEAWLAFLAIVVWHFYYVIFNPDVYPINLTWLTGKVNEQFMEKEYPLELKRIKETQRDQDTPGDDKKNNPDEEA